MSANLKKSKYFIGLSDAQIATLSKLGTKKSFAKGKSLMTESEQGKSVYFVLSGRVDVSVTLAGSKQTETISTLNEGELVGELVLFGKTRRSAHVTAKDAVEVIEWDGQELLDCFEKHLDIGYILMRNISANLAERLIATNQFLRNALTLPNAVVL